jgi:hypothetical protein
MGKIVCIFWLFNKIFIYVSGLGYKVGVLAVLLHTTAWTTTPLWQNWLQNVLKIQGLLDIVIKSMPCPNNGEFKEGKHTICSWEQQGYNSEDFGADWDTLSDMACSTIQMMLLSNLAIQYKTVKPASSCSPPSAMPTRRTPKRDSYSYRMPSGWPATIQISL